MAEFKRDTERFVFAGIADYPADIMPQGKFPYALNMRAYADGEMRPRPGLVEVQDVSGDVHSLMRLNDPTEFNNGVPAIRLIGAGDNLYIGEPNDSNPSVEDSGYSGDPLTFANGLPPQATRPFVYVADEDRYRKFLTDPWTAYQVGIAQPGPILTEPDVRMKAQERSPFDIQTSTLWVPAGTAASAMGGGDRINTTISQILYDDGNTGYCSIVPANTENITVGTLVTVGQPPGDFDNEIITDVTIPVAPTTVESIIYDSGATGLCTVMPVGSLGVGQLEAPSLEAYRRRAHRIQTGRGNVREQPVIGTALPREGSLPVADSGPTRRIRQVDFPVNCIIEIGGEIARIESVALGPDGRQSFRCRTSGTVAAGATITGLAAFRIYLPNPRNPGDTILRTYLANTLSFTTPPVDTKARLTAGTQTVYSIDLSKFSDGTAVLPEDELHLAIKVNRMSNVRSVRVYIDVDKTVNDFLQNYYFHEWRASDIISSIQETNAANVTPLVDSRKTVVANWQLDHVGASPQAVVDAAKRSTKEANRDDFNKLKGYQERLRTMLTQATATDAISTQLGLGNNQWIDLRVKIGKLVHVGTDPTRTLADAKAFEILIYAEGVVDNVTPEPLTVQYSDLQIYGGGGPDVGAVGDPLVYCYRYRSSMTGGVSNPSPASRGGVIPRRQNVGLIATPSSDPQVDKIDWFRLGGALSAYTYVGTGPNSSAEFLDDRMDSAIDGAALISYENFQPWPLADIPRVGTCKVAGTAIEWQSGDQFDTRWAPGSIVLVNGRATSLYASPTSATLMHVVDCVASGDGVQFSLPGPTILSQPLRSIWGDVQGYTFACGDQINPGVLYWCNSNNVEAASDANALVVTSGSEALMAGGIYNAFPFVFSSEDMYVLITQPGSAVPVRAVRSPCGRGFWTPWAWCIGPEGIYFLTADGIALTTGGPAQMLTTPDLRAIFPTDGVAGESINGIPAPDMNEERHLRLSYIAGWLYFDYVDQDGDGHTLLYDTAGKRWFLDESLQGALRCRLEEPGAGVYNHIIGASNGSIYQFAEDADNDAGDPIEWAVHTRWVDGGAPRQVKQFGDIGLNFDNRLNPAGVVVQIVAEDGKTIGAPVVYGANSTGRDIFVVGVPDSDFLANNLGLRISGVLDGLGRQSLYWWEPAYLFKAEDITTRATDWDDLGYYGAKFIQGVIIRANTYNANKLVHVQRATADGEETMLTLTLNHDGEAQIAYPLASTGWDPFIGELIRLKGADDVAWNLLSYRFVWEPAPELATQWETQFTSNEWPGYGHCRALTFGYEASAPFVFTLTYDDRDQTYILPSTGGLYKRVYFVLCPGKGKSVRYRWKTDLPGRLYKRDLVVWAQGWGLGGGYQELKPFGGPSRSDGAAI